MPDTKVLKLVKKTGPLSDAPAAQPEPSKEAAPQPKASPKSVSQEMKPAAVTNELTSSAAIAIATKAAPQALAAKEQRDHHGLSREQMISIYRTMYLSRKIDDKEI